VAFDDAMGSADFDPNQVADLLLRRAQPDLTGVDAPINPNIVVNRLTRKVLFDKPAEAEVPDVEKVKAKSPLDLSGYGTPVEDLPDLSQFGTPAEAVPPASPTPPPPVPEPPKHNAFMRGFVSGMVKENPETLAEALEGIGHLAPKDFKDAFATGSRDVRALSDNAVAKEYAKTGKSMWDIRGIDDALTWAGETFGSGLASTVPSLATGLGGAVVGGRVGGRTGAMVGAGAGAAVPSAMLNYGSVYKALKDEKVDPEKAAEYAGYAAIPMAMLDTASVGPIITRLGGAAEVKQQLARSIAKRIAAEAAKGAGREGITEGIQDVIQSATVSLASDKPFWTAETAKSAIENMAGGALVGGGMGAGAGIRSDQVAPSSATAPASPPSAASGTGPQGGTGGPAPGTGPQGGPQPSGGVSPDVEEFLRRAQSAPQPEGPDLSAMSEAEKIAAYAAARDAFGGAREDDILRQAGFSDERIAQMSEEARVEAVIRAGWTPPAGEQEAKSQQSKTSDEDSEYAILRMGGYTDDNIRDMSKAQRDAEVKYYRDDLGINVAEAVRRYPRPKPQAEAKAETMAAQPEAPQAVGTRHEPIIALIAADVARAQPAEPVSPAQAEAENYRHAHLDLPTLGLTGKGNVSVETGAGGVRKGVDRDGKPWQAQMPEGVAYGRIKGTQGADGQPLDIFIGPNPHSSHVFVIDQHHPKGGGFDEHKIMAGFVNPRQALEAYKASYTDGGGDRIGHVRALSAEEFKAWLKGDTTKPIAESQPASAATTPDGEVRSGEVLAPAKVYAEPTQAHHDQIEAVLGRDYDRVLPADAARAAEILSENEGMAPDAAFQQAVVENAVAQGYLTTQEAIDAYGQEVQTILEPEREAASERGGDAEPQGAAPDQKPAGDAAETGVVPGGGEAGGETAQAAEGQKRDQPDTGRADTDAGGEAVPAGRQPEIEKVKIGDAGEKIGGARKDQWAGRGLDVADLEGMTGAELERHVTKTNIWPRPDYVQAIEDGMAPVAAALLKRIYDRIATKPAMQRYDDPETVRKNYIKALSALRDMAAEVQSVDDVKGLDDRLIVRLGSLAWDAAKSLRAHRRVNPLYVSSSDVRAAETAVLNGFPTMEPWQRLFNIRRRAKWENGKVVGEEFSVDRKNAGRIGPLYATREEAVTAAKAAYEALSEDRKKGAEEPKRPHLDQVERSGPDYRGGRDVTGEDFIKDFGFRGVEFGNWVAGDERQKVVNLAYDALSDLARVLGLPPKAMSLNGTLAVAFGARGRGGRAAAHYEADRTVVNMTKLSGAGSLAHEWAHALDHYLGEAHAKTPYKGAVQSLSGWRDTPRDPKTFWRQGDFLGANVLQPKKLRAAGNRLMDALFNKLEEDAAFEARISREIEVRRDGQKSWQNRLDRLRDIKRKGGSGAGIKEAETQVEVWGRSIERLERERERGIKKYQPSEFLKQATALSGESGDYWRRPNEMFARSFEAYVFDKIAADGFSSQYLVQGVEEDRYGAGFKGNPYPAGAERVAINAAYDRLMRALTVGEGKLGEGTRLQAAEGEPEPVETVTKVTRPQPQPSPQEEQKAVATAGMRAGGLAGVFQAHLEQGGGFPTILAARKMAKDAGFTDDAKEVEEQMEAAVVRTARGDIATSRTPQSAYTALVALYGRQPRLGTRTSTSVRDQAYSTPVPLAYLASKLAGITDQTTVYEPTAGNGALLIDTDPAKVKANEVNPGRAAQLRDQGYKVQGYDASNKEQFAEPKSVDVVIANPPFGTVKDGAESKRFDLSDIQPGYDTTEIDHVIALRALAAMKDDGRAVLLLGGVSKTLATPEKRSDAYNGKAKRQFYKVLYDNYGVTDHFTVAGELYERQGAGWPVDVIVIEGRKKSARALPAVDVPRIYHNWKDLGGLLDGLPRGEAGDAGAAVGPAGGAAQGGAGLEGDGGRDRGPRGGARAGLEQPAGVRGQRAGRPDDAGAAGAEMEGPAGAGGKPAGPRAEPASERPSSGLSDEDEARLTQLRGILDRIGGKMPLTQRSAIEKEISDIEARRVSPSDDFEDIFADALDEAYGKQPAATQATERSDERGQPIIETGVVLRTKSGRETAPAPRIDATTDRKLNATMFRLDSWLLDEARKEVAGNDYQTTVLKGLNPKNFSQSDRDTVNLLLFGDTDGPRPSDVVRIEGPSKKARDTRSTEDVAASAAQNAADAADAAFSGLYQLFGGPKVSSGFSFDEETYAKAKPLFEQAAQKFKDFLGDTRELVKRMVAHMRDTLQWPREVMERMGPYLKRFIAELSAQQAATPAGTAQPQARAQAQETDNQVTYTPKSKVGSLDTLTPVNMRRSIESALDRLEERVGPVDAFVATELGYSPDKLAEYFGAEQVDALALAIDNIKRGKGFVIGDQTGIGKGRVNAAIIRWAIKNGRIPVFVTEKPGLYADMYRDLNDIGISDDFLDGPPRILATNAALKMPLDEDGTAKIETADAKQHNDFLMKNAVAPDAFFKSHDMVFTNYSQMQTHHGEDTKRRAFLKAIAPNATFIFDESHNAGGQKGARKSKSTTSDRAGFARELVQAANGVFYSSATYAKRPEVMDLYAATDMVMAVDDLNHLAEAISRGRVPMQQVVASMLAEAGQYIRRERSFAGIDYNTPLIDVDRATYDQIAHALAAIQDLSKFTALAATEIDKRIRAEGAAMGYDNATGEAGASSTSFTALMHNVINQMLLAMKVDGAADRAIAAIRNGEKVVLTVANTMEAFLTDYAEATGLSPGDTIEADFSDVLHKYLDRTRTVTLKKPFAKKGEAVKHFVSDEDMGPIGVAAYNRAKAIIAGMDLSRLPVSPIDYLKGRLHKAGYSVGEITGRSLTIDYSGDVPVLRTRPGAETSTRGRNAARARFNKKPANGGFNAIVINQAGSTGISMHASKTFDDQSKRRMIIVQPEGNIDTHMQLLGRVNRTGQVVLPSYDQLVANIPAELRPAANLAKKMASLNANTTASRTSALTAKDVPDFLNEYGDQIAVSYIAENLEMNARLAFPLKVSESGKLDPVDAMRKLTGRIPLLPLAEQEEVYDQLTGEYTALIQQLEAAGENALEAKTFDLKARTLERSVVQAKRNDSGSPFAAPVVMEKVSIVRPGKPFKPEELIARLAQAIGYEFAPGVAPARALSDFSNAYAEAGRKALALHAAQRADAIKAFNIYTKSILDDIEDDAKRANEANRFNATRDRFTAIHQLVPPGARLTLKTSSGNLLGVVIDVNHKATAKNPLALSTWKVTFAVPDATRQLTLPFSRLVQDGQSDPDSLLDVELAPVQEWIDSFQSTIDRFQMRQTEAREERYIATGNLLAAYDWLDNKGTILNYTDAAGAIRQGILTSRDFDLAEHAVAKGKVLENPADIRKWLDDNPNAAVEAENVKIGRESRWSDRYVVSTPKAKKQGGVYYLDKDLTALTGDFYSARGIMSVTVAPNMIERVIARLQKLGARFKVPTVAPKVEKVEGDDTLASLAELTPQARERVGEIDDLLRQMIRHLIGDRADLRIFDDVMPIEGGSRWGELAKTAVGARGLFSPRGRWIALARIPGVEKTAFHEAYHAIEYLLQTPAERALMERETAGLRRYVARKRPDYSARQIAGLAGEEVRAIAFEEYADERSKGSQRAGEGIHVGVRRFFERLYQAGRRLLNGLRGLGFATWDDIFDKAYRGGYAAAPGTTPRPEAARPDETLAALHGGPGGPDSLDNTVADLLKAKWLGPIGRINMTDLRAKVQDKFIRIKKLEEKFGIPGGIWSAHAAEGRYYGRTGWRLEQLEKQFIDPLIAKIREYGLSIEEVNDYLYARHAQERNEKVGLLHPAGHPFNEAVYDTSKVGASGMSTDEANAILASILASGRQPAYNAVETMVRDIIDRTRDALLAGGLITQETYDTWKQQYNFYVPLRGFADGAEHEQSIMSGRGFDTRGKEAKQAFGRKSEADGPLNYILMQAEMAIVRAEKNRVGNTFLRFVQNNPDPDRWEINKPKIVHVIDQTTGLITTMPDNFADYRDPNVFITKVGGVPYRIRLKGPDGQNVARALNNMGASSANQLVRAMAMVTRLLARLSTSWNPEFLLPNFIRDGGEAFINLSAENQRGFVRAYARHFPGSILGAIKGVADKGHGEFYADAFREFDRAGGRIRFFGLEDADDISASMAAKMRRLQGGTINTLRDYGRKSTEALEIVNGGVENASRLAAYLAARDMGFSQADAATLARELTVNFNRKGELGTTINALYLFANASIQGATRMLRALQSRHVRRALYALAATGVAAALYNLGAGGDDEQGDSYFTRIPTYERDKNLIVMWPKGYGHDGQYVKVPLPYGYAMFYVVGSHLATMLAGKETPGKAMMAIAASIASSFDPLGGDENWLAKLVPTVARPAVHIATNENWTGRPLYPTNTWDKSKPASQQSFRTNSEFAKGAAAKINEWTGGSTYQPGAIDLHPATIDHWMQTLTGGLGRFAKNTATTAWGAYKGEEWEASKAPILRRFAGSAGTAEADSAAYYEARQPVTDAERRVERARKDMKAGINVDESRQFIENNANRPAAQVFKQADDRLKRLRAQEERVKRDDDLPEDEKRAQIKEIRGQMRDVQNAARRRAKELKGQAP